ncbi:DUF1127 domain-containing protein [Methylopila sp. M107]|uniref:DUF1127 domain-containing protein n=1 Tax=Methylopila sp. M107 TaxID=1101190 RepID=UPI00037C0588|nr:DUF1127 domain-containing protein [Methylopila sp. M107]
MSFLTENPFQNRAASHGRASLGRLSARLKALAVSLTRRRQVYALSQLDDRMLSDIGVTRAELEEANRWSLWRDPGEHLAEAAEQRRAARQRAAEALKGREV